MALCCGRRGGTVDPSAPIITDCTACTAQRAAGAPPARIRYSATVPAGERLRQDSLVPFTGDLKEHLGAACMGLMGIFRAAWCFAKVRRLETGGIRTLG